MRVPTVTTGYAAALQESLADVHHNVRGRLKVAGQAMKETDDRRMRDARYFAGKRVWLHKPRTERGLSPKLQSSMVSPYVLVAAQSDVTYKIGRGRQLLCRS